MSAPDVDRGLEERLDLIAHLLTALVTKGMTRKEAVLMLASTGLQPKQIAGLLGLTGNHVSVVLYDAQLDATKTSAAAKKSTAKA